MDIFGKSSMTTRDYDHLQVAVVVHLTTESHRNKPSDGDNNEHSSDKTSDNKLKDNREYRNF